MDTKIETPLTHLQLKRFDEQGAFAGYASIFNVLDNQNDLMLPGAFAHTLEEHDGDIKLLWQHRFEEPIGYFTLLREDARGLYVEGRLLLELQRAKEAHALLKSGAIAGLSIGYMPVKYHIDGKTGARVLEEVALYEISLVTFPANEQATVHAVKHQEISHIRNGDLIALADEISRAISILS